MTIGWSLILKYSLKMPKPMVKKKHNNHCIGPYACDGTYNNG